MTLPMADLLKHGPTHEVVLIDSSGWVGEWFPCRMDTALMAFEEAFRYNEYRVSQGFASCVEWALRPLAHVVDTPF